MKTSLTKLGIKTNEEVKQIEINGQMVEIKQYLPFEQKAEYVEKIVNAALSDNVSYYNPVLVEIYEIVFLCEYYTNIVFTKAQKDNIFKTYDIIVSSQLASKIIAEITDEELNTLQDLVLSTLKNVYGYTNSIRGVLDHLNEDYNNLSFDSQQIRNNLAEHSEELLALRDIMGNK